MKNKPLSQMLPNRGGPRKIIIITESPSEMKERSWSFITPKNWHWTNFVLFTVSLLWTYFALSKANLTEVMTYRQGTQKAIMLFILISSSVPIPLYLHYELCKRLYGSMSRMLLLGAMCTLSFFTPIILTQLIRFLGWILH